MRYIASASFALFSFYAISCSSNTSSTPQSLKLEKNEITLRVGEKADIRITQSPSSSAPVVWDSSDKSVATVFFGEVTALKQGSSNITVTVGDESATCKVIVPERTYQLVWADEFEGDQLNLDNWTYEVNGNGGGNAELQYYTDRPENIRVADGLLTLEARKEDYLGKKYTSARIITKDKQDFKYGKVEARLKVPSGRGTWPALWMLGYGSWPDAGEIDIMEHVGYEPNIFHTALHTKNKNGMNGKNFKASQTLDQACADDFHIITMEWIENDFMGMDAIKIYVDGKLTTTFAETKQIADTGDWPFNDNFFFIINLAIGGNWGGAQGVDDSIFDNPILYQIDYVRVYQYKDEII